MNPLLPKKKKSNIHKAKEFVNDYGSLGCFIYVDQIKYNAVEDNKDGTLSLVQYSGTSSPLCIFNVGSKPNVTRSVQGTLKKCIQGQVYRQAQNDCKGTGTAANYYGAQKFQWCLVNDRSCEKLDGNSSYVLDNTKSPAAMSCASETILNKAWGIYSLDFIEQFGDTFKDITEIPSSDSDYYWSTEVGYGLVQSGSYDAHAYNWKFKGGHFLMTTANYVLCGRGGLSQ